MLRAAFAAVEVGAGTTLPSAATSVSACATVAITHAVHAKKLQRECRLLLVLWRRRVRHKALAAAGHLVGGGDVYLPMAGARTRGGCMVAGTRWMGVLVGSRRSVPSRPGALTSAEMTTSSRRAMPRWTLARMQA